MGASPVLRLLALCSVIGMTACAATSTGAPTRTPAAPFATAVSNRAEPHADSAHDDDGHTHVDPALATEPLGVALVSSELVVGPNRFAVGLFDAAGQAVNEAEVHFHYFDLHDPQAPVLESHAAAVPRRTPDGSMTIFAHERDFARAGNWGVEVQAEFPDGTHAVKRIGFTVLPDAPAIRPGAQAPAVDTPTAADVGGDLARLSSAPEPNPAFYQLSLAEALANGKPTVLLFSTPAFCQTRFCGPAYEIAGDLQQRFGDRANFVHVEVYTGLPNPATNNWEVAPAMVAFGLSTEPWLYLVDGNGVVDYRVESIFTVEEVERHLEPLLN